jgi:hypothetical protein
MNEVSSFVTEAQMPKVNASVTIRQTANENNFSAKEGNVGSCLIGNLSSPNPRQCAAVLDKSTRYSKLFSNRIRKKVVLVHEIESLNSTRLSASAVIAD